MMRAATSELSLALSVGRLAALGSAGCAMLGGAPDGPIGVRRLLFGARSTTPTLQWLERWTVGRGDGLGKTLRRNAQVPIAWVGSGGATKREENKKTERKERSTQRR